MFMCLWISGKWFVRLGRARCGHGAALKVQLVLIGIRKSTYKILLCFLFFVFLFFCRKYCECGRSKKEVHLF